MSVIAAGTLAIGAYSAYSASKNAKKQSKQQEEGIAAQDPYGAYRDDAAKKLNALVADPSSVQGTADYKARMQAAARTVASQGYTGSGNAILAASDAGGAAYQSAFNNLALLSGAGTAPGSGYANANSAQIASGQQQMGNISGIGNSLVYGAGKLYDAWNSSSNLQSIPQEGSVAGTYSPSDITW